jgi:branched-chain amino acid transport system ATP-binding protein
MAGPLLQLDHVTKRFGRVVIAEDLSLTIGPGETAGIVGPNGAGKTSLFGLISGDLAPAAGEIRFAGRTVTRLDAAARCRLGIGRTYQVPRPFGDMTVFENVLVAAQQGGGLRRRASYAAAVAALERTGMSGQANMPAERLGLLQRKRLELARALATQPLRGRLGLVLTAIRDDEVAARSSGARVGLARMLGVRRGGRGLWRRGRAAGDQPASGPAGRGVQRAVHRGDGVRDHHRRARHDRGADSRHRSVHDLAADAGFVQRLVPDHPRPRGDRGDPVRPARAVGAGGHAPERAAVPGRVLPSAGRQAPVACVHGRGAAETRQARRAVPGLVPGGTRDWWTREDSGLRMRSRRGVAWLPRVWAWLGCRA